MKGLNYQQERSKHWLVFLLALAGAAAVFLPYVLYNRGLFVYLGDFNVQQIPFYKHAHEMVRAGNIGWDWGTDLGANFIGSYSFYLFFSPFFWLTLPFPTEWLPYLMAPLLILKTGCAALTSYFYVQRFAKNKNYAVIGALLYAFSGFTSYNIFFNHFHEVIVFFPLMLVGLEELLVNNRRGAFAITVAINALVNYWFFVGEVVFVMLYYFIRCTGIKGGIKKLPWVALEAVLGTLCATVGLLPSGLAVLGNPRTTLPENMLKGWQLWLYTHEQRQPGILASFFVPPESPPYPNLFPDHGAKWSSLSAWLPLFSMTGVLAFLISARKNWLRKLILLLFTIAMVPGLNSLFIGLNYSYYTRWFYMLVLLLCAATVVALENTHVDLNRGFRWNAIITACILLPIGLTPVLKDNVIVGLGLARDMSQFWVYVAIVTVCMCICCLLLVYARKQPHFTRITIAVTLAVCVGFTSLYVGMCKTDKFGDDYIIDNGVLGRRSLSMPRGGAFYRTDIMDSGDNFGMYWNLPNIQAFHSVVPVSIMKFYPEVGVKRDVSSRPGPEYYALRSLFSVKYLFVKEDAEDQSPMPGYEFDSEQLQFNIYRNKNYLPMGLAFDSYIDQTDFENTPEINRHMLLMRGLLLDEEQIDRYGDMLQHEEVTDASDYSYDAFLRDVSRRNAETCYSFVIDNGGFTAKCNLPQERLMFFSVPFENGWSATVNGSPVEIEQVDIGFMAVPVPTGECVIRFTYRTPGLRVGLLVSGGAALLLTLYILLARRRKWMLEPHGYELFGPECFYEGPEGPPYDNPPPDPPELLGPVQAPVNAKPPMPEIVKRQDSLEELIQQNLDKPIPDSDLGDWGEAPNKHTQPPLHNTPAAKPAPEQDDDWDSLFQQLAQPVDENDQAEPPKKEE